MINFVLMSNFFKGKISDENIAKYKRQNLLELMNFLKIGKKFKNIFDLMDRKQIGGCGHRSRYHAHGPQSFKIFLLGYFHKKLSSPFLFIMYIINIVFYIDISAEYCLIEL